MGAGRGNRECSAGPGGLADRGRRMFLRRMLLAVILFAASLPAMPAEPLQPTFEQVYNSCDAWLRGSRDRLADPCLDAMSRLFGLTVARSDKRGICVPATATPEAFAYAYTRFVMTNQALFEDLADEPWQIVSDDALRAAWPCADR